MKTIWQTSNRVGGGVLFVNTTVTTREENNNIITEWTTDKTIEEIREAKMCFINAPDFCPAFSSVEGLEVYPAIIWDESIGVILPDYSYWEDVSVIDSSFVDGVITFSLNYGEDEEHLVAYRTTSGIL